VKRRLRLRQTQNRPALGLLAVVPVRPPARQILALGGSTSAVLARPDAWGIGLPFIAFGGEFPLEVPPEVLSNPSWAGVIVDNPHVAAACLSLWGKRAGGF
jgi:hypothetical protein